MSEEISAVDGDEVVVGEVVEAPEPLLRIRASVYETERGGLHLAFRIEGMEHDAHVVLKPAMVKLLARAAPGFSGGNPIELLRQARAELDERAARKDGD